MAFTFDWTFIASYIPVVFMTILAIWKENYILFLITFGIAWVTGLNSPDIISGNYVTNGMGITVGLCLIAYAFFCVGMAFRLMFWRGR